MTARNPTATLDAESAGGATTETSVGIEGNLLAVVSYVLGFVTGVVVLLVERENQFVRFHAAQSIVLFAALFVASIVLSVVGMLSTLLFAGNSAGMFLVGGLLSLGLSLLSLVVSVGAFVLWIYLMIRAYQGKTPRIPVVAGVADKLA